MRLKFNNWVRAIGIITMIILCFLFWIWVGGVVF